MKKKNIPPTKRAKTTKRQTVLPTVYTDRYTQAPVHPHKHRPPRSKYTPKICTLPTNFLQHSLSPIRRVYSIFQLYLRLCHHAGAVRLSAHKLPPASRCAGGSKSCPSLVSSPWLSAAALPTTNSKGPRRMSRKSGTPPRGGTRISYPSDGEAWREFGKRRARGEAAGAQQRHRDAVLCVYVRVCACMCGCLDLRPCLFKAPLGV